MGDNEYFDVPLCRVQNAPACFPKSNVTVEEDSNLTTIPATLPSGQVIQIQSSLKQSQKAKQINDLIISSYQP